MDQLAIFGGWHDSLYRSFDGSTNNSGRIGHPNSTGDVVISRISRGRGPLSLEELQDVLHVPLEEVHSALDLGEGFADSSVVNFKVIHDLGFACSSEIVMTSRRFYGGKTETISILFFGWLCAMHECNKCMLTNEERLFLGCQCASMHT